MKTVYFVRHGESEANVGAPIFQGESSPLTEKGEEQAKYIAQRASKLSFDALIASPAVRTQETARYISEMTGKPVESEELFTERRFPSELLGKPRQRDNENSVSERLYDDWFKSFYTPDMQAGDGENFAFMKARVSRALAYLESRPEPSLLVVTHGFFLHMTVALVLLGDGLTIDKFKRISPAVRVNNTGVTRLDYLTAEDNLRMDNMLRTGWMLRVWNDHAHLG